ncbi:hypothetical protein NA645_11485 [Pseudomonas stutzeri]|uniref:hypothetical protein n=1 Tax=Stutzerimonas stutzeri TaxID=316 RepID=UPI00210B2C0B|nr:hypothetical protein [Stutzerimonas stutzeri]MCQ4308603.1 hypothetical protein [Stutzerimonas stutzeri]
MSLPTKLQYLSLISAAMLISLPSMAQQPTNPMMANMNAQLAKLGGTMQVTAEVCGGYTDEQLVEHKQQQKDHLARNGMDAASFDKDFDAGVEQGKAKWDSIPASERQAKCDEFKQQMEELAQQFTR